MKLKMMREVEVEIDAIQMDLPVNYGDEDMPNDFPFRKGDMWSITVEMDTGKIRDWPENVSHDLFMKVCDQGSYYLLNSKGAHVAIIEQDYVPHGVVPGEYGDYVNFKIRNGRIENWEPDLENLDDTWTVKVR